MVEVDAFVDHADHDVAAAGVPGGPCLGRLRTIGVGRRARIAVHAPQRAVGGIGVVGNRVVLVGPVRLGIFHGRIGAERLHGGGQVHVARQLEQRDLAGAAVAAAHGIQLLRTQAMHHGLAVGGCGAIAVLHQQLAAGVGLAFLQALGHQVGPAARAGRLRRPHGHQRQTHPYRHAILLHRPIRLRVLWLPRRAAQWSESSL